MPHYLLKGQSTEAFAPGWIVKPGSTGGWLLPNDDATADLNAMPWVAAILFVLIALLTYYVDVDDTGRGLSPVKLGFLAFWALVMIAGSVFSKNKAARRRRMGDTLVEVDDALLAPGVGTAVRIYQTRSLPIQAMVVDIVCMHEELGNASSLWSKELCRLGPTEMRAGEPTWEGRIEIPGDADVPRPSDKKLEDRNWDPPIKVLGPTLEVENRAAGRSPQSRYWKLRLSIRPDEGDVIHERFDLHVFFPADRRTLLATQSSYPSSGASSGSTSCEGRSSG